MHEDDDKGDQAHMLAAKQEKVGRDEVPEQETDADQDRRGGMR